MPPKVLTPLSDIAAAIADVPRVLLDGDPHVDLAVAIQALERLQRVGSAALQHPTRRAQADEQLVERDAQRDGLTEVPGTGGTIHELHPSPPAPPRNAACTCGDPEAAHPRVVIGKVDGHEVTGKPCQACEACDGYVDATSHVKAELDGMPCTCGHAKHEGPCPEFRGGHEANGPCLCTVYDPVRLGDEPELPSEIMVVGSLDESFHPERSARQADPVD